MTPSHAEALAAFRALHRPGAPLVLPNAWDAGSARVFEVAGFPAVGTTSAGLAWSLGYPDGERLPRSLLFAAVERLVATVAVPVTVDIERGYGESPAEVAATVEALVQRRAVGVNVEDGGADPEGLCARIRAMRHLPVFVNARTDLFLYPANDERARVAEVARRLARYVEAGADGVFVPGLGDLDTIRELARNAGRPLNVYAATGVPPVAELARAGVGRVSVGCGPMQATLALTRRIADELRGAGTYEAMTDGALSYGDANGMFAALLHSHRR